MIIKNSGCVFNNEDIEEIASDVFLVIWKNKEKLDINKEIAPYIAGITKKLILKRKNNNPAGISHTNSEVLTAIVNPKNKPVKRAKTKSREKSS